MFSFTPLCRTAVFFARIVMPFSRSRSIESMTRSLTSWFWRKAPDCQSMASTSVVFPWSTWATIATLRRSSRTAMRQSKLAGVVPRERANGVGGGARDRLRMPDAGPQIDRVGIAGRPCRGTEWGGCIVNLGVGAGRAHVLEHEAIADAAREPARERARERGRRLRRDRLAVHGRGARLRG